MNYLAHIYLSGENEKVLVGNFIGDYVKGKNFQNYHREIAQGILLHRQIDTFTDSHKKHKEAKQFFRAEFGLYSGIIIDFIYDHFLARNWNNYSEITLRSFTKRTHAVLLSNYRDLPARVQGFLPFLIQNRRLESYASVNGIIESMKIMGKYSSLPSKSEQARIILERNYDLLEENFNQFMPEVKEFVRDFQNQVIT